MKSALTTESTEPTEAQASGAIITNEENGILRHTSNTGRYLTGPGSRDFVACQALAAAGLLRDHGPQRLAAGDHYYTMTGKGRTALNAWTAAQPPPPKKPYKRPPSRAFVAWQQYRDATYDRLAFAEFWFKYKTGEYQFR